jgi:hypothetical protein
MADKQGSTFIPFFSLDLKGEDPLIAIPALIEWASLHQELTLEKHGLDAMEITEVEAFCWYATVQLTCAGFIVRAGKRRFHLQCALDDGNWEVHSLSAREIGLDDPLPSPPDANGPPAMRWHSETDPYNKDLKLQRVLVRESAS